MRNAGASVDPPTDPSEAESAPPRKHPVRRVPSLPRGVAALPQGVSADVFAEPSAPAVPAAKPSGGGTVPPPAPPVEPWRVPERPAREEPVIVPPPDPAELLDPLPPSRTLRRALIGFAALLLLLYLVPAVSMAGKILPGTMVLGVDIGGQSRAEAVATLRERLYAQARTPIIVRQGLRRLTLDPVRAGLALDAEATVDAAQSGFPSPAEVWNALTGSREVKPVVSVDRRKLDEMVAKTIAEPLETPRREGDVSFDGVTPVPTYPRAGRVIDRKAAAEQIVRGYLNPEAIVVVPAMRDVPRITRAEVRRALNWASRAVAAPLTLTHGTASVTLSPATLARHLTFEPEGVVLRPRFDAEAAIAGVEATLVGPTPARDAGFTIKDGRPVLVPGRPGDRVDTERLAADVLAALDGGSRTVPVPVVNGPPRITDDAARRMGIREEIGRFTTSYACCPGAAGNIRAAAALLDGRLVPPGETFSFNEVVGPRTVETGFDGIAPTLIHGRSGTDAAGMSQVATTLMNAVIRAALRVTDYTSPEVHASHLPAGTEAAVSFPDPDLRWKNDSPYGVLIQASVTGTSLTVKLWSTKRYDVDVQGPVVARRTTTGQGPGCVTTPGQPGFTATVTRVLRQGGEVVSRQTFRTFYRGQAGVACR